MKVQVKLFARARDIAGADLVELELPEAASVADLRTALAEEYPAMAPIAERLLVAIGTDYATEEQVLAPHAEIACFPPVSGG